MATIGAEADATDNIFYLDCVAQLDVEAAWDMWVEEGVPVILNGDFIL